MGPGVATLSVTSWTNLDQKPVSSLNNSSWLPVTSFLLTSVFFAFLPRRRAASLWLAHAAKNRNTTRACLTTIFFSFINLIVNFLVVAYQNVSLVSTVLHKERKGLLRIVGGRRDEMMEANGRKR